MKILMIYLREKPYDARSVRDLPSGGTEKAFIFLGEALRRLGHEVTWATCQEQWEAALGQPFDAVIAQDANRFVEFPDARRIWWLHHYTDQTVICDNLAFGRFFTDRIVTLSRCQQEEYRLLGFDSVCIPHGVWHEELAPPAERDPFRLIYCSTPFRGLYTIPELFSLIRRYEPRANITICSSMGIYGLPDMDRDYQAIFDSLAAIEGVRLTGALNQHDLYRELAQASIFFYPCTWRETYCMALDEALAHGLIPVVTNLGALPERAPACGDTPNELLPVTMNLLRNSGSIIGRYKPHYQPLDWLQVARRWHDEVLT